ncbi:hypothetical protein TREMEDRAFT_27144, partial [Tremella mesenterica DSM 1558]|uniref:uncharacterized protein n=1 Tax=Tremella mesenterica (strain ATCC 24925 / CBS 8224 / DSM 1558 / NBRC 9311 / NRRL Y-6157 / RJB 2259-6 / UBC 559-6) TaxID=578456 RepID=UPI0003F490FD
PIRIPMSRISRKQLTELLRTSSSSSTPFTLLHAPPQWPYPSNASTSKVHISILDSSFNPPTTAHLALICAPFPPITDISNPSSTIPKSPDRDYTTRLLLLSLKNVDKTPSSTDATPQQRIEMMILLSKEVEKKTGQSCAVGICHEATFVGKNKVIREYLSSISTRYRNGGMGEKIDLTFLIGTDTLTRFFSPRYYPENQMISLLMDFFKSTTLVSALRDSTVSEDVKKSVEITILKSEVVRPWTLSGKVRLLDLGEETEGVSSTSVRKQVKDKLRHKSVDGDERKTQRSTKEDMVGTYMLVDGDERREQVVVEDGREVDGDEGKEQVVVEDGREDGADERREQVVVQDGREEDMIKGVLNTINEYIKIEGLYI